MTYFNQDVSGTVFSSKLKSYCRCLLLNRTLGKRNIIFCVVKNIMVQVRAIFKRSRKEGRYKTSITRERASLCSILYWFFCFSKWQLPHVYKLHKNQYRLSCTALRNVWPNWVQIQETFPHTNETSPFPPCETASVYMMRQKYYRYSLIWMIIRNHNYGMLLHVSSESHED